MEAAPIRACQREGCKRDLDNVNGRRLKSTAVYCSPECRREQNRANGDGDPNRKWVGGYWRTVKPRKPRSARRHRNPVHHSLGITAQAIGRQERAATPA